MKRFLIKILIVIPAIILLVLNLLLFPIGYALMLAWFLFVKFIEFNGFIIESTIENIKDISQLFKKYLSRV